MTNDKVQAYLDGYKAVASEIARLTGWKATLEGGQSVFIDVRVPDGSSWAVGDVNETWGADYYADQDASERGVSSAQAETDVPSSWAGPQPGFGDPKAIAAAVVAVIWEKRRELDNAKAR